MKYNSEIKEIREYKLAKSVLYNFALAIFITLALGVVAVYAFGLRLDIVLSDSMATEFYKNDIVVIREDDEYKVKDIIEYKMANGASVTHRIVEIKEENGKVTYYTKGDNVPKAQPEEVPHEAVVGKVIAVVPNGNHIYKFIKSNYFLIIDIILGVWVLTSILSGEHEMRKHDIAKD